MKKARTKAADILPKVERAISGGELREAAILVKEADLSEAEFDTIMDGRPDLRAVLLSL